MDNSQRQTNNPWLISTLAAALPCIGMGLILFMLVGIRIIGIDTYLLGGILVLNVIGVPFFFNLLFPVAKNLRNALIIALPTVLLLFFFLPIRLYFVSLDKQYNFIDQWDMINMSCFLGPIMEFIILISIALSGWFGANLNSKLTIQGRSNVK